MSFLEKKLKGLLRLDAALLVLAVMAFSLPALAAPKGGEITRGKGRIEQSGSRTDIHQNTNFMATRWQGFDLSAGEIAQAHQPNIKSRLLIRVDNGAPTSIAGQYISNGITIIENRAGVQFSQGAVVNVGGLLATSSRFDEDTALGRQSHQWRLSGTGGDVVNHGRIIAGPGGVVLAAVRVENTGSITAQGGDVSLGAGSAFTIDFSGGGFVGFEVSKAAGAELINTGEVKAEGGIVRMTAQEARDVRANVVSVGGVVKATKIKRRGGVVYLYGGEEGIAEVSGKIEADEKIEATSDKYVVVKSGARMTAPEILVGGDFQGKGDTATAQRVLIEPDALLDAGQGGRVIVWSDEITWFYGALKAEGGFAEISGKQTLAYVNFAGIQIGQGTLMLDPYDLTIGDNTTDDREFAGDNRIDVGNGCGGSCTVGDDDDFEVSAAAINALPDGTTLVLWATNTLTVSTAISHSNLIFVLRTPLGGSGSIAVNADIDVGSAGSIIFHTGTGGVTYSGARTFTAGALVLEQGKAFAELSGGTAPILNIGNSMLFTHNGNDAAVSFYSWMNSTGTPTITVESKQRGVVVAAAISNNNNVTLIADGNIAINADINAGSNNNNVTLNADGNIAINADVNAGTGAIRAQAGGNISFTNTPTLTAGTLSLQAAGNFSAAGPSAIAVTDTVEFIIPSGDLAFREWMDAASGATLTLTAMSGSITVGSAISTSNDVTLNASRDIGINASITVGSAISTSNDVTLNASRDIAINASITVGSAISTSNDVTLNASRNIAINASINAGNGAIKAQTGTSSSVSFTNTPTLTAGRLVLQQGSPFVAGQSVTLTITDAVEFIIGTGNQEFHPWMDAASSASLTLTAMSGSITVGSAISTSDDVTLNAASTITISAAITSEDVTLNAASTITISAAITSEDVTLNARGGAITISANITSAGDNDVTVLAAGDINLSSNINAGTGEIGLGAGYEEGAASNTGMITFTGTPELTANKISLSQDAAFFPEVAPMGVTFTLPMGVLPSARYGGDETQEDHAWFTLVGAISVGDADRSEDINFIDEVRDHISVTVVRENVVEVAGIDQISITFQTTGNIIIPAGGITITGVRNITLIAASIIAESGGTITGNVSISANNSIKIDSDITSSGNVILTSANILEFGAINSPHITGASVFLNSFTDPGTADTGSSIEVTSSTGSIFIGARLRADDTIALTAAQRIIFQTRASALYGSDITLTSDSAVVNAPVNAGNQNATISSTGNITIESNINVGTGELVLIAGAGEGDMVGAGKGVILFASTADDSGDIEILGKFIALRADPADSQTVEPANRNLTLKATGRRRNLGDIIPRFATSFDTASTAGLAIEYAVDINTGSGDLTLQADTNFILFFSKNGHDQRDQSIKGNNITINTRGLPNVFLGGLGNNNFGIRDTSIDSRDEGMGRRSLGIAVQRVLSIEAFGDINYNASAYLQGGVISLEAGMDDGGDDDEETGSINFGNTLTPGTTANIHAFRITLTADTASTTSTGVLLSGETDGLSHLQSLIDRVPMGGAPLVGTGEVLINVDLNVGDGDIYIRSRAVSAVGIIFDAATREVTAANVVLDQDTYPSDTPAVISFTDSLSIFQNAGDFTVQPWMVAPPTGVTDYDLTFHKNAPTFGQDNVIFSESIGEINVGTGTLTFETTLRNRLRDARTGRGHLLLFDPNARVPGIKFAGDDTTSALNIRGGNIIFLLGTMPENIFTGLDASNARSVSIIATSDVMLNGDFPVGGGDLVIEAGGNLVISQGIEVTDGEGTLDTQDDHATRITGKDITLTGSSTGDKTNIRDLTVNARGNININTEITTTGNITLEAGKEHAADGEETGKLNLAVNAAAKLTGAAISLTADTAPDAGGFGITINASGALTLATGINTTGALILFSAAPFADLPTGATITAGAVELTYTGTGEQAFQDWMDDIADGAFSLIATHGSINVGEVITTSNDDVTLTAAGDIILNASILSGTGNITIEAGKDNPDDSDEETGKLNLAISADVVIEGTNISLTADTAPDAGSGGITINATTGTLSIAASINTTGELTLTAASGAIMFSGTPGLNASVVVLQQPGNFASGATAPVTLGSAITSLTLIYEGTGTQNPEPWMFGASKTYALTLDAFDGQMNVGADIVHGGDLVLEAARDININADINVGTNDLTIEAGKGTQTAKTGKLNLAISAEVVLIGMDITLTADTAPDAGGNDISVVAEGDLTIATSMNTSATLILTELTDAITFTGTPALTAADLNLGQDTLFGASAPATITITNSLTFNYRGSGDQVFQDWMDANAGISVILAASVNGMISVDTAIATGNGNLTLLASNGNIEINANIDTGEGNITLRTGDGLATGAINFASATAGVTLSGADISLTSQDAATAGTQAVTINATGDLTINADLNTSANLTLEAGMDDTSGAIILGSTAAASLTGAAISLTADTASSAGSQAITIAATGALTLTTNIATSGDLTLSADTLATTGARTFEGANLGLSLTTATDLAAENLTLTASTALTVNANITTTGNLVLSAAAGRIDLATSAATSLTGNIVSLTASDKAPATARTGTNAISIMTTGGALTLDAGFNTGSSLSLDVSTGAINFGRGLTLAVGSLSLTQAAVFGATAPGVITASALTLIYEGTDDQIFQDWFDDSTSGGDITLTAGGNIEINASIAAGGNLTLTAGSGDTSAGAINFSPLAAIRVVGGAITLTADAEPTASNQSISIEGNGTLNINTSLNAGTADLTLLAGAFGTFAAINFASDAGSTITLTGALITLTDDTTSPNAGGRDVIISASGNVELDADINVGAGSLRIEAGRRNGSGQINFGSGLVFTAGAIFLAQNAAQFATAAPATFSVTPQVDYFGGTQTTADWFTINSVDFEPTITGATDYDFAAAIADATTNAELAASFNEARGELNLGTGTLDLTLTTSGDIIFPASLRRISAGTIILVAQNIVIMNGNDKVALTGGLTLFATSSITLQTDIVVADGDLEIMALGAAGALIFGAPLTDNRTGTTNWLDLAADNITLAAGTIPDAADYNLRVRASNDLTMGADITIGVGLLNLEAGRGANSSGAINFVNDDNPAINLAADEITLTADEAPEASTRNFGIATDAGNLNLNASIETSGSISMAAADGSSTGAINFSPDYAVALSASGMTLTAETAPAVSNQDLAISVSSSDSSSLIINFDINVGTGDLSLATGEADIGAVLTGLTLTAGNVSLQQAGAFPLDEPDTYTVMASTGRGFINTSADAQSVYEWMFTQGQDLAVVSGGDITLPASVFAGGVVDNGAGDLTLEAGRGTSSGEINFPTGATSLEILGDNVTLLSDVTSSLTVPVTVRARRNLTLGLKLRITDEESSLQLEAGQGGNVNNAARRGAIIFSADTTLRANGITFTADAAPPESQNTGAVSIESRNADRNININADLDAGAGGLVFTSSGGIVFSGAKNISLAGQDIRLTAVTTSAATNMNLTVNARGSLTVNMNIDTGGGNLVLVAGAGDGAGAAKLNLGSSFSAELTLSGRDIRLEGEAAPDAALGAITIRATRNLNLFTDIDAGTDADTPRVLTLEAGRGRTRGSIIASGRNDWSADNIIVTQDGEAFDRVALGTVSGNLTLNYTGSDANDLPLASWVYGATNLTVNARGAILVNAGGTLTGDLALNAGTSAGQGAIVFSNTAAITLAAANITLTADLNPRASNRALTITAATNLNLDAAIHAGSGALELGATAGAIALPGTSASRLEIRAASVVLRAATLIPDDDDNASSIGTRNLRLRATGFISFRANLRSRGDIILIAGNGSGSGQLNFRDAASTISGRNITLNADTAPGTSAGDLTIEASGNLTIGTGISITGALALTAGNGDTSGAINFTTRAVTIAGAAITLTADAAPSASNQDISIDASGDLTINTNINAGTAALSLDTDAKLILNTERRTNLDGSDIAIISADALVDADLMNAEGNASNAGLRVRATGGLTLSANINTGAGTLSLEAGRGSRTSGAIILTGASALTGRNITLTADASPDAAWDNNLTATASGNITINRSMDAGTGDISLTATGALVFNRSRTMTLEGTNITLSSATAPRASNQNLTVRATGDLTVGALIDSGTRNITLIAGNGETPTGALNFTAATQLRGRDITLTADVAPTAGDANVLARASRHLRINTTISTGTGNITLNASGELRFSRSSVVVLSGAAVSLTAASAWASGQNLTIRATGNLTIATNINTGPYEETGSTGDINIEAGTDTGQIIFSRAKAVTLTGGTIRLASDGAPRASNQNLRVEASSGLTIRGRINAGSGNLMLIAGSGGTTMGGLDFASANLTGRNITLTADDDPNEMNSGLDVTATGNLTINTNINAGTGDLVLLVSRQLRFSRSKAVSLSGDTVSLTAASTRPSGQNLTIHARQNLTIATDINTGLYTSTTGDLEIEAGRGDGTTGEIIFSDAKAVVLSGGVVSLTSDAAMPGENSSGQNLSIIASGDLTLAVGKLFANNITLTADNLMTAAPNTALILESDRNLAINTNIDTGTGNLTLTVDRQLRFSTGKGVSLSGMVVSLTAASTRASNRSLTITAASTLTIAASLNTGRRDLSLEAVSGAIMFTDTPTLDARVISLTQASAFDTTAPAATLDYADGLILGTTSAQTVQGWMIIERDKDLTVRTSAALTVNSNINVREGNLELDGGTLMFSNSPLLRAIRVTLVQDGLFVETAPTVDLHYTHLVVRTDSTSDQTVQAWMVEGGSSDASNKSITIAAAANIQIDRDIDAGNNDLILNAGDDDTNPRAINFITLAGDGDTIDPDADIADLRGRNITLIASGTPMTADISNQDLKISATRSLTLMADLNSGSGSLELEAGLGSRTAAINFAGRAVTLTGAAITLTADAAPTAGDQNIIIEATGDLTINTNINSGSADLTLGTTTAKLIWNTARTTNLSGNNIRLISATTTLVGEDLSNANLSVKARVNLALEANINVGTGNLTLEAGQGGSTAGALVLSRATVLTGRNITLIADEAPSASTSNDDLTVRASGNITIRGILDAGSGDIMLTAGDGSTTGAINFARVAGSLTGGDITLTADGTPSARNNQDITITATGNATDSLTIEADLNAGTGDLTLETGGNNITFNDTPRPGLTASTISLMRAGLFGASQPQVRLNASRVVKYIVTSDTPNNPQKIQDWMLEVNENLIEGNQNLFLMSASEIEVGRDISIGGRNLTLIAGRELILVPDPTESGQNENELNLLGNRIILQSGRAPSKVIASSVATSLTISARSHLTLGGTIDAGTGNLILEAGRDRTTGRLDFDSGRGTRVEGKDITLMADLAPRASGQGLTIRATDNLIIETDINTGTGRLDIEAGSGATTGAINFTRGKAVTLTGGFIRLASDAAPQASRRNLTVRASSGLTIIGNINTGAGDLRLIAGAGAINFGRANLRGRNITLTADAAGSSNNSGLDVTATGNLMINADIQAGTGNLTLSVRGQLRFSRGKAVALSGAAVSLTAASTRASGRDLTIGAAGNLTIATNLDTRLYRGRTGNLTLEAGIDPSTGAIIFSSDKAVVLSGGEISLTSDMSGTSSGQNLTLIATATATTAEPMRGITLDVGTLAARSITLRASYLTTGDAALTVSSDRHLTIETNITTGASGLTLIAGAGVGVDNGELRLSQGKRISLSGADVSLTADQVRTNGHHLTVSASGSLTIETDLHAASNRDIRLEAGQGAITFTGTPRLTARVISLTQASAFGENTFGTGTSATARLSRSRGLTLEALSATANQVVHGWMVVRNRSLSVRAGGNIEVNIDINTGSRDLTLIAGYDAPDAMTANTGAINFSSSSAVTLSGSDITLNSATQGTSRANLTVSTTGNLSFAALISSSLGNIELIAGGALNFTAASNLSAVSITLTAAAAPTVSNASVEVMATTGDLAINTNINTGTGNLTLNAGGQLGFSRGKAVLLSGAAVSLTAASTRASGENLTIRATGDLTIATDLNAGLSRGTIGNIVLVAGNGEVLVDDDSDAGTPEVDTQTGTLNFTGASSLSGRNITLTSDAAPTGPTDENADISVTSSNHLTINADIATGAGDLTLSVGNQLRFSRGKAVSLSGAGVSLTAASTRATGRDLTITATGDLTIATDLNTSLYRDMTGALMLEAGDGSSTTGVINFSTAKAVTLSGGAVTLSGDAPTEDNPIIASNQNLTIISSGDMTIGADINTGSRDIRLTGSTKIEFSSSRAVSVMGRNITLIAVDDPTANNQDITIDASRDLTIGTRIRSGTTTTGDLSLTAGRDLSFSGANPIELQGVEVTITSAREAERFNQNVVVKAYNDIIVNSDFDVASLNLVAGDGAGTGAIMFDDSKAVTLEGDEVMLTADRDSSIVAGNASDENLVIRARSGDIQIAAHLHTGAGDLTLNAGGAINFATREVTIAGNDITLTAQDAPVAGNQNINITASGNININADINSGDGQTLSLTAGDGADNTGAVNFSADRPVTLSAGTINLTFDGEASVSNQNLTLIGGTEITFTLSSDASINIGTGLLVVDTPSLMPPGVQLTARRFNTSFDCGISVCVQYEQD